MDKVASEKIKKTLEQKRHDVERQLASLKFDDPFEDESRLGDNAASDTEAREEEGHERVEALREELTESLDGIKQALKNLEEGTYGMCIRCKKPIEGGRLTIFPMAKYCLSCEKKIEAGKK